MILTPVSWAIVTPSYSLDFARCQLLCRSIDRFLNGDWHHYIVVDPVDIELFSGLKSSRRTIVDKRSILPPGFFYSGKIPFLRLGRFWLSRRHGIIFGWQMQQLTKMLMANFLSEQAMLFCDSDLFFVRPFNPNILQKGRAIRYISDREAGIEKLNYIANSVKLLGLDPANIDRFCVKEQLVSWDRQTALELMDYLSQLHGKPWHEAIGSRLMFTEYNLYSVFVAFLQRSNPNVFLDNTVYCKTMWHKETAALTSIEDFCAELEPQQVAICIQSLIGAQTDKLEQEFAKQIQGSGA